MAVMFASNSRKSIVRILSTIVTGCILLFVPGLTMKTVVVVMGSMLAFSGLLTLLLSNFSNRSYQGGFVSVQGTVSIIFGLILISSPAAMVKIFMVIIGIVLVMMGLAQLFGSMRALGRSVWAWFFMIIGFLTLISGSYLLSDPFKSAEAILPFLGALILLNGLTDLLKYFKGPKQPKDPNEPTVQDISYEEVE